MNYYLPVKYSDLRYLFHIAYQGTAYHGWQRQPQHITVQETIENELRKILRRRISCIGCGRTDTGVHASQYFFHIDGKPPVPTDFQFILNKNLPDDIAVFGIIPVETPFHAQYSAIERTYHYYLHTVKDPNLSKTSALYEFELDPIGMKEALSLLTGEKDFGAFCLTPDKHKSTICNISDVELIFNQSKTRFRFSFTADRFIKSMIRLLVGNIIEISRGNMSIESFKEQLKKGIPPKHHNQAYPQGLYLAKVSYPSIVIPRIGQMPVIDA